MGAADDLEGTPVDGPDAAAAAQMQSADRSVRVEAEAGRCTDMTAT